MSALPIPSSSPVGLADTPFGRIANGLMVAMPLIMVMAHRSSPLISGLAVVAMLAAYIQINGIKTSIRWAVEWAHRQILPIGIGLAVVAYFLMTGIPFVVGEAVLCLLIGALLIALFPEVVAPWALPALLISMALSCGMILVELKTGLNARHALGLRWNSYIFNRPVMVLLLLFWPVVALAPKVWRTRRLPFVSSGILLTSTIGVLLAITIAHSESQSAQAAMVAGALGFLLARTLPRLALFMATLAIVSMFTIAPFMGETAARILPTATHTVLEEGHSRARILIWQSFGDAARQSPVLGQGFGTTRDMDERPVAAQVAPEHKVLLGAGHPHQMPLQIWVELGGVGALMGLMAIIRGVLQPLSKLDRHALAPRYGLLMSILMIALVGHGLWQGWWLVAVCASVAWFRGVLSSGDSP